MFNFKPVCLDFDVCECVMRLLFHYMTPLDHWLLLIVLVQALVTHKEYVKASNCAVHWGAGRRQSEELHSLKHNLTTVCF